METAAPVKHSTKTDSNVVITSLLRVVVLRVVPKPKKGHGYVSWIFLNRVL